MKQGFIIILIALLIFGCTTNPESSNKDTIRKNRKSNTKERLLLLNANLIDGNGTELQKEVNILIENGFIKRIFPFDKEETDTTIRTIDLEGKYIIPGLIEAHAHLCKSPEKDLTKALYFGITSIRDMAGDGSYLLELQQAIKNTEIDAPDVYFSAVMAGPEFIEKDVRARISTPERYNLGEAPWMQVVDKNTNIFNCIHAAKKCGASGLKLYADLTKETVFKLTEEAHKQGLMVWSHAFIGPANVLDVVESDVDVISHIQALLYDKNWDIKRDGAMAINEDQFNTVYFQEIIQNLQQKQILVDATLSILKSSCNNDQELMNTIYRLTHIVYEAGIPIVAGTDNSLILKRLNQPALYDEIQTLVNQCGITPLDAIKCATKNGSIALGIEKTHGTIEVGKAANLLVLNSNPLEKIENIQTINLLIKDGIIIKKKKNE